MSPSRQQLASALFEYLLEQGADTVLRESLARAFDPTQSPMCMLVKKDPKAVLSEFLDSVEYFLPMNIDERAFCDFFSMISSIHEDDDEYRLMTTASFGMAPY